MDERVGHDVRVLHVDDEPDFAELTADMLEREDDRFHVETVVSADDGLERLSEEQFDCVVSDYDMPRRDGIAFLEQVRAEYPDLPFILYTGKGSEEIASEAISAGVTDYLQKEAGTGQYAVLANRVTNAVEKFRAQRALTERTRRLETLISNLPGMVYRCRNDPTWPMETVEGEVEALTGYSADALEAGDVLWGEEILHPDDRQPMWEAVQEGLSEDGTFEVTYRIKTEGGSTKWVWERGRGVHSEAGELVALEGFITDITDRKERDRELQRHQAYLEESSDVITVLDDDGTITYQSPAVERTLGYAPDEFVGQNGFEYIHPDDVDEVYDAFTDLVDDPDGTVTVECRFRTADGDWRWLEVRGTNRLDHDAINGIVTNNRDITERKERQQELERTHTVLSTLFETLPVGVLAEDADRNVLAGNDRVVDLFGLSATPEDIVGADCEQMAEDVGELFAEPARFVERIDELVTERESVRNEELSLRDGRTFARSYEPIELPGGDGHLSVYRDITTRKRHEQKLKRQNERFEELASAVSHDLHTPLETARGRAELAVETGDTEQMERALDALERANELREEIAEVLRTREVVGETEPVDVGRVSRDIWETIRTPEGTSLQVHDAPSIDADPGALRRLLENLFLNAVEHGGEAVTVQVGETDRGFYVADDGAGIPDDARKEVFTPGYSTKRGGSGVGLASVRHIVAAHDWEIRIVEGSTGGARFDITVPSDGDESDG